MAEPSSHSNSNSNAHGGEDSSSQFTRLSLEQLAFVLEHVPMKQRLSSIALVHSTFAKAASLATTDISPCYNKPGLSKWLAGHITKVPVVHSISVSQKAAANTFTGVLKLPAAGLQNLRVLSLSKVRWQVSKPPSPAKPKRSARAAKADVPSGLGVLTALTKLSLYGTSVQLSSLAAATSLRELHIDGTSEDNNSFFRSRPLDDWPPEHVPPYPMDDDEKAEYVDRFFPDDSIPGFDRAIKSLVAALPRLQQLTALHLGQDVGCSNVLAEVSCLQSLQELVLADVPASSFPHALPLSLTKLHLQFDGHPTLTPSAAPGIAQLTALQELHFQHVSPFDVEVLAGVRSTLTRLVLNKVDFAAVAAADTAAASGQSCYGSLQGLTRLTALRSLELNRCRVALGAAGWVNNRQVNASEAAALTSFPCLATVLLRDMELTVDHFALMFPAHRQLPHLHSMLVTTALLSLGQADMQHVAACCPNLDILSVYQERDGDDDSSDEEEDEDNEEPTIAAHVATQWPAALGNLTVFNSLRELKLVITAPKLPEAVWEALGGLTALQRLRVSCDHPALDHALHLTSCRSLELLEISSTSSDRFDNFVRVDVSSKAPYGHPPDVVQQLPAALYEAADTKAAALVYGEEYGQLTDVLLALQQEGAALMRQEVCRSNELRDAQVQLRQLQQELEEVRQRQEQQSEQE